MIDWVLKQAANPWIAVGLYWVPLAFCAVFYFIRTMRNFAADRRKRETEKFYRPTDTIGTLIGRAFITILPVGNFCAAVFDLSPEVFGRFFEWLGKVFDQPLVPERKTPPQNGSEKQP